MFTPRLVHAWPAPLPLCRFVRERALRSTSPARRTSGLMRSNPSIAPGRVLVSLASFVSLVSLAACGRPPAVAEGEPAAPVVEYVTHQEILTPLPLRVRLPARYGAERVLVFFRTWGSRDWNTLELARAGQTWAGEVSCREVSTVTGDTRYFFLDLDPEGEAVSGSGSAEWPHVATVVGSLEGGAQALQGAPRPARCHDPSDCPPDFPGCPGYAVRRPTCRTNADCEESVCEWDGYCGSRSVADLSADPEASDDERLGMAVRAATRKYRVARR